MKNKFSGLALASVFCVGFVLGHMAPVDAVSADETGKTADVAAVRETADAEEAMADTEERKTAGAAEAAGTADVKGLMEASDETEERAESGMTGTYRIRFHEDFDDEHDRSFTQEVAFGETVTLMTNPWSHEGYAFAGWFASGYGVNHALANVYADGVAVRDLGASPGDVIELYAGWKKSG